MHAVFMVEGNFRNNVGQHECSRKEQSRSREWKDNRSWQSIQHLLQQASHSQECYSAGFCFSSRYDSNNRTESTAEQVVY